MVNEQYREKARARFEKRGPKAVPREGMTEKMREAVRKARERGESLTQRPALYADQRVVLDDACTHCVDPIQIIIEKGQLLTVEPEMVWYLRGGG